MSIVLDQLTKRFEGHPVVNRLSLEIANGEFFVLIGPSGSGKSTVLRMIAGLNTADEGRVLLHDRDVTFATPQQRGVGFVFQHYALFQHMSVADNIEFGLRVRRVGSKKRHKRRDELLELVGLAGLGGRMPAQLSGGQQQRVALARAVAHQPEVLLLDEPFGALDAKIRLELRRALHQIQTELGITTIFVTHDQEEAFELADRLGVMNFGRLLEVGTPGELYQHPQTEFVATFLGTANLMVGESTGDGVRVGPLVFPLGAETGRIEQISGTQRVQVLFRPEDVTLALPDETLDTPQLGQGEVEQNTFSGSVERLRMRLPSIPGVRPIAPPVAYGEDVVLIEATRTQDVARTFPLKPGDLVKVGVRRIHALVHPGLSFLILTDASESSQPALDVGGQIARLAHARVTILGYGMKEAALKSHLQEAKEKLGSGLALLEVRATRDLPDVAVAKEAESHPYDLVVLGSSGRVSADGIALAERILRAGDHHLLLVPAAHSEPAHALICVMSGEPGKEDVLFAGRFLRHLGAQATLMSVLPAAADNPELHERAKRFLSGGARTLEALGVPAQVAVRSGNIRDEIVNQMQSGEHDLLVLGAPLTYRQGEVSLEGIVGQILKEMTTHPVLIVRSRYAAAVTRPRMSDGRINIVDKIIP
ncbi:MAG TPA: ATP-binding cassette domain-containing protein [Anaerolineales bacterium]|jgi:sulfate transport system ATP-binding protein